jgi:hypothetical protein
VQDRTHHGAARIEGGRLAGKVLVAGGQSQVDADEGPILDSVEIFDPATGAWSETFPLAEPRIGVTLTALDGGGVLVLGTRPSSPTRRCASPTGGCW